MSAPLPPSDSHASPTGGRPLDKRVVGERVVDERMLDQYFAGECNPDDAALVHAWAERHPDIWDVAIMVRRGALSEGVAPTFDEARAWAGVREHLGLGTRDAQRERAERRSRRDRRTPFLAVATGAMAVVLVAIAGLWITKTRPVPQLEQHYQTVAGQRSVIPLTDGSTMTLAPSTTAIVSRDLVTVTGEAYFLVTSRPTRPFVVRTANATVHVLGTRFAVRQYPDESRSRVVVEEGRVALGASRSLMEREARTTLSANMLAFVTDSGVTVSTGIATREYTGWTTGVLVFDWMALGDLVHELGRAYGVTIRVPDSALRARTLRMDVSVSEDALSRVLDVICRATDAHYTRDGSTFVLAPGRSSAPAHKAVPQRQELPQPEQVYGR